MDIVSYSEKDTKEFAKDFAKKIKPGDVLALYGDLGSGKTTFTRYLAGALGAEGNVTSPTFVMEKRYGIKIKNHPSRTTAKPRLEKSKIKNLELIHIDCYRMDEENVDEYYLQELFEDKESIKVIEWSEKIEKYLPTDIKKIKFEYLSENERKIAY